MLIVVRLAVLADIVKLRRGMNRDERSAAKSNDTWSWPMSTGSQFAEFTGDRT